MNETVLYAAIEWGDWVQVCRRWRAAARHQPRLHETEQCVSSTANILTNFRTFRITVSLRVYVLSSFGILLALLQFLPSTSRLSDLEPPTHWAAGLKCNAGNTLLLAWGLGFTWRRLNTSNAFVISALPVEPLRTLLYSNTVWQSIRRRHEQHIENCGKQTVTIVTTTDWHTFSFILKLHCMLCYFSPGL